VVTGAGKGIGRATALALAKDGANVVIASRTMSDLQSLAREIGNVGRKALPVEADLTRESHVKTIIQKTVDNFGGLDILVNNAGIGLFGRVEEFSTQDWDQMFELNMRGLFLCTREALPYLKKEKRKFYNKCSIFSRKKFICRWRRVCSYKVGCTWVFEMFNVGRKGCRCASAGHLPRFSRHAFF